MKMKKFFGLKMTLAALAVVSFASCYDSEGGDVIIPQQTTIDWPAPVYVVNGTVTNFDNGAVMSGVNITGLMVGHTTDANGDFSATLTAPFNGEVVFTKDGFFKTARTLKMATLKTGNAVYNMNVQMVSLDSPNVESALKESDVTIEEWPAEAIASTAADLAAIEELYDFSFTNTSDKPKALTFGASMLTEELPYGVVAAPAKTDEEGLELFIKWVSMSYGNDPFEGYGVYSGLLTVTVPALYQVTKIIATPVKVSKTLIFPLSDGDFEQPVEMVENYNVTVEGVDLSHDHGHGHGTDTNAGGGETGGE